MWFRTFIDNDGSKPLTDEENPYAEFSDSAGEMNRLVV
jgi:hypothetical protein